MSADDPYLAELRAMTRRLRSDPAYLADVVDDAEETTSAITARVKAAGLGSMPATALFEAPRQIAHRPGCSGAADRAAIQTYMGDSLLVVTCRRCEARAILFDDGTRAPDPAEDERQRRWAAAVAPEVPKGPTLPRHGGPPSDTDRPRDRVVRAARDYPGAWPPTQKAISGALGWTLDGRRIRQVQGPRGWPGILEDASAARR